MIALILAAMLGPFSDCSHVAKQQYIEEALAAFRGNNRAVVFQRLSVLEQCERGKGHAHK